MKILWIPHTAWHVPQRARPMATPNQPSLAYHRAYDLLGAQAARTGGPTAVLASSPFYAREVIRRLVGTVLLSFPSDSVFDESETRTVMGPEVDLSCLRVVPSVADAAKAGPRTLIWAGPERDSWQALLGDFHQLEPPLAVLVLATSRLRCLLPEWQDTVCPPAATSLVSVGRIAKTLRKLGYATQDTYGFHGPRSLLWGTLSRIPGALGRDDLVDRCYAAMRQAYAVHGWSARWAPVWLVAARWDESRG